MIAMRALTVLIGLVLLLSLAPARAQVPAGLAGLGLPAVSSPDTAERDVEALLRVLENDGARAALVARLKGQAPAAEAVEEQGFARRLAETTRDAAEHAVGLLNWAGDAALAIGAALRGTASADLTALWRAALDIGAVIVTTFAAFALLRWVAIRMAKRLAARAAGRGWAVRVVLLLAESVVDALSVGLAWGAGYGFALGFGGAGQVGFYQALFLNAFLVVEMGKVALRMVLVPGVGMGLGSLRPLPLDDTEAAYWYFWTSRLASLLGYSFMFAAPLVLYADSWAGAQLVRVLAMVSATAIVMTIVLQNRVRVRKLLALRLSNGKPDMLGRIAARLSTVWHLIAIGYALAVLVVWVANPRTALPFMLGATAQSALAAGIGLIAAALVSGIISRGMRLPQDLRERLPLLEGRLNAYVPAVLRVVRLGILACVLLAVAHAWSLVDVGTWLGSPGARAVVTTLVSAALVVLLGLGLHLVISSWVEYRLNPNFGTVPTARERTLLSLLRNALTVALVVVVAMLLLSELGVNIAPLLAGAGVIGLAIGFGAQKLVQDIITGVFIQFENAMNEGEVVTAAGISGLVERLTIRSVSIRDLNGVLHVIPFSTVDKVSNMMRHFSCHLVEIGVAYDSDIPAVKAAMLEAFDRLKQTDHGAFILEPMEMYGLARFADSALVVMARFKTMPGKHWNAGRAYNEIVKGVFDERGINIPFPQRTVHMVQDRSLATQAALAGASA